VHGVSPVFYAGVHVRMRARGKMQNGHVREGHTHAHEQGGSSTRSRTHEDIGVVFTLKHMERGRRTRVRTRLTLHMDIWDVLLAQVSPWV